MTIFLFSFLAGFVTIAGPCILPLLPIILGTSTIRSHPARPLFIILGFILSFSFFSIALTIFGNSLGVSADTFRYIASGLIALFGISMVFPKIQESFFSKLQPILTRITPKTDGANQGLASGFILGTSLGLIWTPCAGPVLGSILTLIASKKQLVQSAILLMAYAMGAGIPMLAIAYGGQNAISKVRALSKYTVLLQRIFGAIIILVAIGLFTGADRTVQTYLIIHTPWLFPNLNINL